MIDPSTPYLWKTPTIGGGWPVVVDGVVVRNNYYDDAPGTAWKYLFHDRLTGLFHWKKASEVTPQKPRED